MHCMAIRRISYVARSVKLVTRLKLRGVASDVGRKNVETVWAWACVGGRVVSEDLKEECNGHMQSFSFAVSSVLCDSAAGGTSSVLTEGNHPRSCHGSNRMAWVVRLDCRSAAQARGELHGLCMSA
jgi:hypothetical protein